MSNLDYEEEESDLKSVMQLEDQFDFKSKNLQQIIWILDDNLYERQRKTIQELSDLELELSKIVKSLDNLDRTYSEFQGFIEAHTEHISTLTRETSMIDSYNEVLQRRMDNQFKLYETIKMMLQGVELTNNEKDLLTNPNFSIDESLKSCENVLDKISRFYKFSNDKSTNIRAVREQLAKMQGLINGFMNKFKEYLKKQTLLILNSYYQEIQDKDDQQNDQDNRFASALADTQVFRKLMLRYRRLILLLFECQTQDGQDKMIINDIGANLQQFIVKSCSNLEKTWIQEMNFFVFNQQKLTLWNAGEKININQDDNNFILIIRDIKKFGFTSNYENLLDKIKTQLKSDENYWNKYFQNTKENNDQIEMSSRQITIQLFSEKANDTLFKIVIDLTLQSCQQSQLLVYLVSESINNLQQDEESQQGSFKMFIEQLKNEIEKIRGEQIKSWEQYLKSQDPSTRHCGVLQPIKNFIVCIKLLFNFISENNCYYRDLSIIFTKTFEWLKTQSNKKTKYQDIVMVMNLGFIHINLEKIDQLKIKEISAKVYSQYRKSSMDYSSYLFCYQFMKFCDVWFKLKELKPSELEHQNFNKNSFLKLVASTFSGFNKSLDSIIKRMTKHLVKEQDMIKMQLKFFAEYVNQEYGELETFCKQALGGKVNPTKQQILEIINQRLNM